jgi:hypothetical protein
VTARRIPVVVALVLLLAGCNADELISLRMPMCGEVGQKTTFLMAQSVPDADLVPCIDADALPGDLYMASMRIDSTSAAWTFFGDWPNTDEAPPLRLDVRFASECDVLDAVEVPTDEPETRRLERVQQVASGYAGERLYVFAGGCVTYRFDARRDDWLPFVHEASQTWTFMPRAEVVRLHDVVFDACDDTYARLAIRACDR